MLGRLLIVALVCVSAWGAKAETPAAPELRPFVRGDFSALLAANAGRPLLINFWSITCPPCLAEMPTLKAFAQDNPDVRLELVATDSFDDEARIARILTRQGFSERGSWVFGEAHKTRLRYDIDKTWRGELPRTYLVGRGGEMEGHSGMLDASFLNTWLKGQK